MEGGEEGGEKEEGQGCAGEGAEGGCEGGDLIHFLEPVGIAHIAAGYGEGWGRVERKVDRPYGQTFGRGGLGKGMIGSSGSRDGHRGEGVEAGKDHRRDGQKSVLSNLAALDLLCGPARRRRLGLRRQWPICEERLELPLPSFPSLALRQAADPKLQGTCLGKLYLPWGLGPD